MSDRTASRLHAFLAEQLVRKEVRRCMIIELFYAHGEDYRNEQVRSWTREDYPEIFEDLKIEHLAPAIIAVANDHCDAIEEASHCFVLRTIEYLGDRQTCNFKLSPISRGSNFDGSDDISIRELRDAIAGSIAHADSLIAMLDELAALRATARLRVEAEPAVTDDLPPDAATGLYLDRPLDAEDLEWLKMAWDAYLPGTGGPGRPTQLMLVFQAIHCDERATTEFLRVMNTIVLPLLRRLRLKEQPNLTKLGAVGQ